MKKNFLKKYKTRRVISNSKSGYVAFETARRGSTSPLGDSKQRPSAVSGQSLGAGAEIGSRAGGRRAGGAGGGTPVDAAASGAAIPSGAASPCARHAQTHRVTRTRARRTHPQ